MPFFCLILTVNTWWPFFFLLVFHGLSVYLHEHVC
jgi:hypothetical protein